MANIKVSNSNLYTNSYISKEWFGGYKLEVDLSSKSSIQDWTLDFELPYKVRDAYGVNLVKNDKGKYTISGKGKAEDLSPGEKTKALFIIDTNGKDAMIPQFMSPNSPAPTKPRTSAPKITTSADIVQDWNGGYKVEVDISAKSNAKDWTLDFELPYKVRDAYGVDLVKNGQGKYTISGQGKAEDLSPGEKAKAIFIVDDFGKKAVVPQFTNSDSPVSIQPTSSNSSAPTKSTTSKPEMTTFGSVVQDWNGGYKVEVDISAKSNAQDWTLDFDLPYKVRNAYGVDLVKNGKGNYTISGQGKAEDLSPGEKAKAIFIIDDFGKNAVVPKFTSSDFTVLSDYASSGSIANNPKPAPKSAPEPSSNAISVGFENHANNTRYTTATQRKDWNAAWSVQMDRYATISNQEAHSGNNSLKMDYPANTQSNAGAKWVVPNQKEYYLSYWVKFDGDFDFDGRKYSGGKLPGLGSGDLASGGKKPNGNNGFTSRYMWRENGQATVYLYHMNQPGTYGEDLLLKDSNGQNKYFERGQWHNMIQRVKVNDGNSSNGEIDVWMDNEQVLSKDNLKFMTNGQGIDTMFFSTFHGGNGSDWWPEKEENAYFDDFVVSTNAADVGL